MSVSRIAIDVISPPEMVFEVSIVCHGEQGPASVGAAAQRTARQAPRRAAESWRREVMRVANGPREEVA